MPVKQSESSVEEIQQEEKTIRGKENKLADNILSSLDLSMPDEEKAPSKEIKKEDILEYNKGGKIDSLRPVERNSLAEEKPSEEKAEGEEEEDLSEAVIPKSKFEKRLNSEVSKRKVIEAELAELKSKRTSEPDSPRAKLENMSEDELKSLKTKARAEWKRADDPDREAQLDQLIDQIDDVMHTGPQRFNQRQVSAYERKANDLMSAHEDIDFEKDGPAIKQIAVDIYNKYPELKQLESGQATALDMAFEHWMRGQPREKDKSKEQELKRQNLKLKQKTSLDNGAIRGQGNRASKDKAYETAKKGGITEKTNYFMDHVLDIDKFLPPELR